MCIRDSPYADVAIFKETSNSENVTIGYSAGLAIVGIRDILEIYLPLFESSNIRDSYDLGNRDSFTKRISFLIDLNKLKRSVGKSFEF